MRILLADDNVKIRAALRLLLEELGEHDIIEAADERQLLSAARQSHADVILFDWELPQGVAERQNQTVSPGALIEELRRIRRDSRIIAMSGTLEAEESSRLAGCDGFVSRTEPPDRLLALLDMGSHR